MSEYKDAGSQHAVIHNWADNKSLNRLCIRLDDDSRWMFGFTSSRNWHNGDTVEVLLTPHGHSLRNVSRGGTETAKFLGDAET